MERGLFAGEYLLGLWRADSAGLGGGFADSRAGSSPSATRACESRTVPYLNLSPFCDGSFGGAARATSLPWSQLTSSSFRVNAQQTSRQS